MHMGSEGWPVWDDVTDELFWVNLTQTLSPPLFQDPKNAPVCVISVLMYTADYVPHIRLALTLFLNALQMQTINICR